MMVTIKTNHELGCSICGDTIGHYDDTSAEITHLIICPTCYDEQIDRNNMKRDPVEHAKRHKKLVKDCLYCMMDEYYKENNV